MKRSNQPPTGFRPGLLQPDPADKNRFIIDPSLTSLTAGSVPAGRMVRFEAGRVSLSQPAAWLFERLDMDPRVLLALHLTGTWGFIDLSTQARNESTIEVAEGCVGSIYPLERLFRIPVAFVVETTLGTDEPFTTVEVYEGGWHHAVSS